MEGDLTSRPCNRGYRLPILRSGVSLNSLDRRSRPLDTNVFHLRSNTLGSLAIGHCRFSWEPECCQGKTSVTLGHVAYAPFTVGKNGASHSVSHSSHLSCRSECDCSSSLSFSVALPSSRVNRTVAGVPGLGAPSLIPIATATAGRMANTFSVLRAPMLSPCRSMIQSSSNTSRILRLMPAKPGPRR